MQRSRPLVGCFEGSFSSLCSGYAKERNNGHDHTLCDGPRKLGLAPHGGTRRSVAERTPEFPYLQHDESVDALTMDYCVANQDGTRMRLLRTNMRTALTELLERMDVDGTGAERSWQRSWRPNSEHSLSNSKAQPLRSVPTRTPRRRARSHLSTSPDAAFWKLTGSSAIRFPANRTSWLWWTGARLR